MAYAVMSALSCPPENVWSRSQSMDLSRRCRTMFSNPPITDPSSRKAGSSSIIGKLCISYLILRARLYSPYEGWRLTNWSDSKKRQSLQLGPIAREESLERGMRLQPDLAGLRKGDRRLDPRHGVRVPSCDIQWSRKSRSSERWKISH